MIDLNEQIRQSDFGTLVGISQPAVSDLVTRGVLKHGLSGAPVVDDNSRLIGFLSEKDCLKAALDASYFRREEGTVQDFMSRDVTSISGDASLIDAIQLFLSKHYRCLPVCEGSRLVGQISRRDILRGLEKVRNEER